MGTQVPPSEGETKLTLELHATAPIQSIELIRSGDPVTSITPPNTPTDLTHAFALKNLSPGEYLYLRIQQTNGGLAWSSPWFITSPEPETE
jgi:hypothetical protein